MTRSTNPLHHHRACSHHFQIIVARSRENRCQQSGIWLTSCWWRCPESRDVWTVSRCGQLRRTATRSTADTRPANAALYIDTRIYTVTLSRVSYPSIEL